MASRKVAVSLATLLIAAGAGAGMSRAGPGSDEAKWKRAKKRVEEGDRFKKRGDYVKAAREYEKAYELVPHPVLFFNLAQVYRLDGNRKKALEYYERYLDEDPTGPAVQEAKRHAKALRKEIEAETERAKGGGTGTGTGTGTPTDARTETDRGNAAEEPRAGFSRGGQAQRAPAAEPGRKGPGTERGAPNAGGGFDRAKWMRIGGMASGGVGLVAFGFAVKYGFDARRYDRAISNYDDPDGWTSKQKLWEARGKRAERNVLILSGVGAAAVAGGAVLYWLGRRAGAERAPTPGGGLTAAPLLGADRVGLALAGSF